MAKGIIYVTSTAVPGLVKIGKTENFNNRMTQLENNGYRNITGLKREFAIQVDNYSEIEQLLANIFSKSQVSDTELFALDLNMVTPVVIFSSGKTNISL